jgi:hypothetical protein
VASADSTLSLPPDTAVTTKKHGTPLVRPPTSSGGFTLVNVCPPGSVPTFAFFTPVAVAK